MLRSHSDSNNACSFDDSDPDSSGWFADSVILLALDPYFAIAAAVPVPGVQRRIAFIQSSGTY
jgi:hypothetical protein